MSGELPYGVSLLVQFAVAAAATMSFGVTFQIERRHYAACGLVGAVGWAAYTLCVDLGGLSAPAAVFAATLPLAALARLFAVRQKAPVTVFLLAGIFPLVPGAGIYYTAYYFLQGYRELCINRGIETFKTAVALALGIAVVCSTPFPGRTTGAEHSPESRPGSQK